MTTNSSAATIPERPTPTLRRCVRLACRHGWRYHHTVQVDGFAQCLGCRTPVRVLEVVESGNARALNESDLNESE